jgi:hypothetical protein
MRLANANGLRCWTKIKWDIRAAPTGHGIIFIGAAGQVYCYVPPGGV